MMLWSMWIDNLNWQFGRILSTARYSSSVVEYKTCNQKTLGPSLSRYSRFACVILEILLDWGVIKITKKNFKPKNWNNCFALKIKFIKHFLFSKIKLIKVHSTHVQPPQKIINLNNTIIHKTFSFPPPSLDTPIHNSAQSGNFFAPPKSFERN